MQKRDISHIISFAILSLSFVHRTAMVPLRPQRGFGARHTGGRRGRAGRAGLLRLLCKTKTSDKYTRLGK